MLFQNCAEESNIIPITGISKDLTIGLFGVLLPLILSIFTSILFARLFTPLFLKAKNKLLASNYKDSFIARKSKATQKDIILKRLISLFLLTFGFLSVIYPLINTTEWLSPEDICSYNERGINPAYKFSLFLTLFGLILPWAMGLWSISWALEDSGLMHYVFKTNDYFEIEPIHTKYSQYLNGYSGISSLLFVIQFVINVAQTNSLGDAVQIFAALLIGIICFFPAYLIFTKTLKNHAYLQKGMEEIKYLTENDLKI